MLLRLKAHIKRAASSEVLKLDKNQFNGWFRGSQAVDESGKPLTMYHGSRSEFEKFQPSESGMLGGEGIYLTPDPEYASEFALGENGNVIPVYASIKNPLKIVSPILQPKAYRKVIDSLMDVPQGRPKMRLEGLTESEALALLKDTDPAVLAMTLLGEEYVVAEGIVDSTWGEVESGFISSEIKDLAVLEGYDGIFLYSKDKNELEEVVAFEAKQIFNTITSRIMG